MAATPGLERLRGKLEALVLRQQWLPGLDDRRVPTRAQYTALNYALASIEAIICKRWLAQVYDELQARFRYGWDGEVVIVLWVHDEIAVCCKPEIAEAIGEILVRHAKQPAEFYGFKVPLAADFTIGRSWAGEPPSKDKPIQQPDLSIPEFLNRTRAPIRLPPPSVKEAPMPTTFDAIGLSLSPPSIGAPTLMTWQPEPDDEYFLALGSPEPGAYSDFNYRLAPAGDIAPSLASADIGRPAFAALMPDAFDELLDEHDDELEHVALNGGNGHDPDPEYQSGERRYGHIVATYIYRDHLGGNHTKIEKRKSPRAQRAQFPQSFWVDGRWEPKKPANWLKVPYRLPALLEALTKRPVPDVFLPEGEKDCDTLVALGLVASTNSEGATSFKKKAASKKWAPELKRWFHGSQRLFILADNDEVGRAFAHEKAQALADIVPDIRIIHFPDVPEGEDVTYWLQRGHSKEELLARCAAAPQWQADELESIRADQVIMRAIVWLWPNRFAVGKIGIVAGLPDQGKGQVLCYMTARMTANLEWPNSEGQSPQGNVIILSAEENPGDSLAPRLAAAGADLSRVHFVKMVHDRDKTGAPRQRMFSLVSDLEKLRRKIAEVGNVIAVLIDPISAYLGVGEMDSYRDTDVRAVLGPLKELAEETKVAVIAVMHFNKKIDVTNALLRVSNSMAFVGLPRHVYGVIADDEHQRKLFVRAKNNDAAETDNQTIAFHFDVREVGTDPDTGALIRAPFIVWLPGYIDITATEAMQAASEQKSPSARDAAKEFLRAILAGGPVLMTEIKEAAAAELISKRTLERAKKDLHVRAEKGRGASDGKWLWVLPEDEE